MLAVWWAAWRVPRGIAAFLCIGLRSTGVRSYLVQAALVGLGEQQLGRGSGRGILPLWFGSWSPVFWSVCRSREAAALLVWDIRAIDRHSCYLHSIRNTVAFERVLGDLPLDTTLRLPALADPIGAHGVRHRASLFFDG